MPLTMPFAPGELAVANERVEDGQPEAFGEGGEHEAGCRAVEPVEEFVVEPRQEADPLAARQRRCEVAQVALERIHQRIAKLPGFERQPREYWLHLHENETILRRLGDRFAEALGVARKMATFDLVRIETALHDEFSVARRIAEEIRIRLHGAEPERVGTCA